MCGIVGFFDRQISARADVVKTMSDTLIHRGPDSGNVFYDDVVGLGHRRLSIIDLSAAANQPMFSKCGRYVIVFNGEIYNFREVKEKLDVRFVTQSDTEVILETFILFKEKCVELFNGMFAFVIYDKVEGKLFIFRDRMGVKPLYYYLHEDTFYFASEILALSKLSFLKNAFTINRKAIHFFLHLGYVPQPETIYNEVKKFPSASFGIFDGKELKIETYWDIFNKVHNAEIVSEHDALNQFDFLMNDAVRLRLISDVPYGVFLSGGIDSSLVAAIAAKHVNDKLKSFTIGFENNKHDERIYAEKVAAILGTEHSSVVLKEAEAREMILEGLDMFGEPFADSSFVPVMLVSQLAGHQVKMVLSGDGGDEQFFGYGVYNWVQRINNPLFKVIRPFVAEMLKHAGNRGRRVAGLLDLPALGSVRSHLFSQEQYLFSEKEIGQLLKRQQMPVSLEVEEKIAQLPVSELEKQAVFDLIYYLRDDLLVKVDRATMHYSIEGRFPLLDYRIVEYGLNLDASLKIKAGISKYIEKKLLYQYLPEHLFNRPKWGFSVPLKDWLKTDLRFLIDDYLNEDAVRATDILNFDYIRLLKSNFLEKGHDYLYNRVWQLIVLQRWMINNR
jgi:asparagine synthase (glutamine-hydrolysing)